jgi:hypothetical protein
VVTPAGIVHEEDLACGRGGSVAWRINFSVPVALATIRLNSFPLNRLRKTALEVSLSPSASSSGPYFWVEKGLGCRDHPDLPSLWMEDVGHLSMGFHKSRDIPE